MMGWADHHEEGADVRPCGVLGGSFVRMGVPKSIYSMLQIVTFNVYFIYILVLQELALILVREEM